MRPALSPSADTAAARPRVSACLPFLRSQRLRSSPNPLSRALPCESSSPSASTSTTLLRPFDSRSCSMRLGFDKVPRGSPHSLARTLRWCARRRRRGDGCGRTSGLAARSPPVLAAAAHALCASPRARPNRRKATGDRGLERSALRALLANRSRLPGLARDTRQNALIECLCYMTSSSTSSTAPPQHAGLLSTPGSRPGSGRSSRGRSGSSPARHEGGRQLCALGGKSCSESDRRRRRRRARQGRRREGGGKGEEEEEERSGSSASRGRTL